MNFSKSGWTAGKEEHSNNFNNKPHNHKPPFVKKDNRGNDVKNSDHFDGLLYMFSERKRDRLHS
jgi:hypothetical protein